MNADTNSEDPATEPVASVEVDRARMTRALRDLEAARARVERDAARVSADTRSELVAELLPVLDGLDRTIRASHDVDASPALVQGVRLVRAQLETVLKGYGVVRIDTLHAAFDPTVHEAVSVVAVRDATQHGTVLEEVAAGYRVAGRLLRPAQVVVGGLLRA